MGCKSNPTETLYSDEIPIDTTNWRKLLSTNNYVSSIKISKTGIYVSSRGDGVFYSGDWGKSWKSINNGLTSLSIFTMENFNNNLFIGSNGVFKSTDNGENWFKSSNGLPEAISITGLFEINDSILYAPFFYYSGEFQVYGLYASHDFGNDWTPIQPKISDPISSIVVKDSIVIIATSSSITRSTDGGLNWQFKYSNIGSINSFAISDSIIFAGTGSLGVFVSNDNGNSWNSINSTIKHITIITVKEKIIFVGTYDHGIYYSCDNGKNWKNAIINLTDYGVYSLAVKDSMIFVGTNNGVKNRTVSDLITGNK